MTPYNLMRHWHTAPSMIELHLSRIPKSNAQEGREERKGLSNGYGLFTWRMMDDGNRSFDEEREQDPDEESHGSGGQDCDDAQN